MNFLNAEADYLNPPESKLIGECQKCGADIYEGETCLEYDSEHFCDKDCALEYAIKEKYCAEITVTEDTPCYDCVETLSVGEIAYMYDTHTFCTRQCVIEYMTEQDEITEMVAGENE